MDWMNKQINNPSHLFLSLVPVEVWERGQEQVVCFTLNGVICYLGVVIN